MTAPTRPVRRVAIKRAYDLPARGDGVRVLVDRLWPRGLRKADAKFDQWRKDLAPTTELRKFYGHRPERFAEFKRRYRAELRTGDPAAAVTQMVELNHRRAITFLTASRDLDHSEAAVLADHVRRIVSRRGRAANGVAPDSGSSASRPSGRRA